MKNITEILSELGIEIPEEKRAEFNKTFAENNKTIAEHEKKIAKVEADRDKYNNYPRELFDYRCSADLFAENLEREGISTAIINKL